MEAAEAPKPLRWPCRFVGKGCVPEDKAVGGGGPTGFRAGAGLQRAPLRREVIDTVVFGYGRYRELLAIGQALRG